MRAALVWLLAAPGLAAAGEPAWQFSERVAVTTQHGARVFHQLDGAGRKHIAIAGDSLAVVWQDNSSGRPVVYAAVKPLAATHFGPARRLSGDGEAHAPVLAPLADGRFIAAWQEAGGVWARVIAAGALAAPLRLDAGACDTPALATSDTGAILAAWTRRAAAHARVYYTHLTVQTDGALRAVAARPVDPSEARDDQLYPSVALSARGALVVWEDRRRGHTTILGSHAPANGAFAPPQLINEPVTKSDRYGRGSGVTRPALARYGTERVAAVWMDKRGVQKGYGVYSADSPLAAFGFGANQRIEDEFGAPHGQWQPAVAGSARGTLVVVWDDSRDDTSDLWMAVRGADGWSANIAIAPAATAAQETSAAVALDADDHLHVLWVAREADDGPTRLYYARGIRAAP